MLLSLSKLRIPKGLLFDQQMNRHLALALACLKFQAKESCLVYV